MIGSTGNPQGYFDYGGLGQYVMSGTMTLTPGVTPSVCSLQVNSLPFVPSSNGTLLISYGTTLFRFYNCKLDTISHDRSGSGFTYSLTIYDRRWMWADRGTISGQYNVHINDKLQVNTEKQPRELLELCLNELGETNYDVSLVPNEVRPEVDWDYTRPADALSGLLSELGCTLCLGPADNRVYVVPDWYTTVMLDQSGVTAYDQQTDPPDPPRDLIIVSAKTKYQHDFLLEAVCHDVNGEWKKIDDLSFTPPESVAGIPKWSGEDYLCSNLIDGLEDDRQRKLARKYLWRAYRIIPNKSVSWEDPFDIEDDAPITGFGEVVTEVRDIELLDGMAETILGDDGEERPKPSVVWGRYFDNNSFFQHNLETIDPSKVIDEPAIPGADKEAKDPRGLYEGGFSIDSDHGIVMFSETVCEYKEYDIDDKKYSRYIACEKLFLRTACHARFGGKWGRHEYSAAPPQGENPAPDWSKRYEMREDLEPFYHVNKISPSAAPVDNIAKIEQGAQYYWNTVALEYQPKDSISVTYIGFRLVGCDGAVRQVTWTLGEDGKAFTRVSRHREEHHLSISYKERLAIEDRRAAKEVIAKAKRSNKVSSRQSRARKAVS